MARAERFKSRILRRGQPVTFTRPANIGGVVKTFTVTAIVEPLSVKTAALMQLEGLINVGSADAYLLDIAGDADVQEGDLFPFDDSTWEVLQTLYAMDQGAKIVLYAACTRLASNILGTPPPPPPPPPLAAPPAPAAFWRMTGLANASEVDTVAGLTLTQSGGVGSALGKLGNARTFNSAASQSLMLAGSNAALSFTGAFTFALWFNMPTLPTDANNHYMAVKGTSPHEFALNLMQFSGTNFQLNLYAGSSPIGYVELSNQAIMAGTWHLLIAWRDTAAGVLGLQLDNGTPVTASMTGTVSAGNDFRLATYFGGTSQFFNGLLDAIAKWNVALSASERESLWNVGAGREYLSGAWTL